jgi:glycosyltransferase involved in cell wall biosynthesis
VPDFGTVRVAVTLEQCWHRVPGGTARATLGTVGAIAERAAELDVEQVGVAAWHRRPAPEAWRPPIEVCHLPLPRVALYEAWHRARRPAVQSATGPVDVVHGTAHVAPPASAPLVATVHDLHFLHEPGHFTARGAKVFTRFLELVRDEAAAVICPSEATRVDCEAAGIDGGRVHVVPWGIDPPGDPLERSRIDPVLARHGLQHPYVLFVGTVEPRKNLARLVEAVRSLRRPDLELVLVGPAGWDEQVDGGAGVRRLGFVAQDDLHVLYAGAAAVCYPSLREGFGLPVLEAMAHGAPVVTSEGTATAEVAGGAAVLVDPLDVDGIAAGIASVLDDPDRAEQLRAEGRARAGIFTWEQTATGTVEAYRAALGRGAP